MIKKILLNNSIKNTIYYISGTVIQKAISFVMILLYTEYLSPAELGLANIILSISTVYELIFRFAMDEAYAKFWFENRDDTTEREKVSGSIVLSSIISCLGGGILLLAFSNILIKPFLPESMPLRYVMICVALAVLPIPFSIFQKKLRIEEKAKKYAIYSLLSTILTVIGATIFVIILGWGGYGYLLALATASIISFIISYFNLTYGVIKIYDRTNIKQLYCYAIPLVPHFISTWGMTYFNRIAIGKILDTFSVGVYNVMNNIGMIVSMLSISVTYVFQPWVYQQLERGEVGNKRIKRVIELTTVAFTIAGLTISLFSIEFVHLFINERYWGGIPLISIIVAASNIAFIGNMITYIMYYNIKTVKSISRITMSGAILNIILTVILGNFFGLYGAAIAFLISNSYLTEIKRYAISKRTGLNPFNKRIYLLIGITTIICFESALNETNVIIRILIFGFILGSLLFLNRKNIKMVKEV